MQPIIRTVAAVCYIIGQGLPRIVHHLILLIIIMIIIIKIMVLGAAPVSALSSVWELGRGGRWSKYENHYLGSRL